MLKCNLVHVAWAPVPHSPVIPLWLGFRAMGSRIYGGVASRSTVVDERLAAISCSLALVLVAYVIHTKCWLVGQHSRVQAVEQLSGVH